MCSNLIKQRGRNGSHINNMDSKFVKKGKILIVSDSSHAQLLEIVGSMHSTTIRAISEDGQYFDIKVAPDGSIVSMVKLNL